MPIVAGFIDGLGCPHGQYGVDLVRGTDHAGDFRAAKPAQLDQRTAYTTSRRVDQPALTGARVQLFVNHKPGGEEYGRQGSGLLRGEVVGQRENVVSRQAQMTGVATEER